MGYRWATNISRAILKMLTKEVQVNIVFEPEWSKDMMSEEAKLELGMM